MSVPEEARVADLALVFIALAYGADHELGDAELNRVADVLQRWAPGGGEVGAREAAVEALAVFLDDESEADDLLLEALRRLFEALSPIERETALADAVAIAEADGRLMASEQTFLRNLAEAWHLKRHVESLLEASSVTREDDWTMLHDVATVYVAVAHSSDRRLTEEEVGAMIECLTEWQPGMENAEAEGILRQAMDRFRDQPETSRDAAERIHAALPTLYRLAVVSDLYLIAEADGEIVEAEQSVIGALKNVWGLGGRDVGPDGPPNGSRAQT